MKKILIDTNALLRFLLNDIPKQADEVERLLKKAKKSEIFLITPQIVIFEIEFALDKYYGYTRIEIVEKLNSISNQIYLHVQDKEIFLLAIEMYKKYNISLPDSFFLAKTKLEEIELFTFDKKLKKLA